MRTNLFDFAWSLKAAAAAGRMKDIGHSQPWLIDALGGKGIPILALRSDADFNAVMRVPELVLRYDWPAFARETGVYTNEKHLRDLVKCCFVKSLTEALKERGR